MIWKYKRFHRALLAFSKHVVIVLSWAMFLKKKKLPTKIDCKKTKKAISPC